ncbi:MAG: metallophosphoesterase [Eubacteriales bacterium]|nr:metallophosphoesterase [Eubacteriales bacterium]
MKILVISDNHGSIGRVRKAIEQEKPLDAVMHCGDLEIDPEMVKVMAGCPCYMVRGNNDYGYPLPKEQTVTLGGHTFWINHGHRFGVSYGTTKLCYAAMEKGADVCLYGHTHMPEMDYCGNLQIMNPGSLTYPRQKGRQPTYGIIEIDENGKLCMSIRRLEI